MALKTWTTVYSSGLDTDANQPPLDNDTYPGANDGDISNVTQMNSTAKGLQRVEAELGVNPGGAAGSVRYRIQTLEDYTGPVELFESADPTNAVNTGFLYVKDDSGDTELFYMDNTGNIIQMTRDGDPATPSPLALPEEAGDPGNQADIGYLYTKDDGGDTELFYMDDGGAVVQITADGALDVPVVNPLELLELGADPGNVANTGYVYTKDVAGVTELFYEDEAGNIVQIVSGNSTVLTETSGPTVLTVGAVADGQVLIRSGATLVGGAGGAIPNAEEFSLLGSETPGSTQTFAVLTNTPRGGGTANTPSGYDIHVYREGQKMKYNAVPADYMDYFYVSGSKQVQVLAPGSADDYEVVYGSQ